MILAVERLDAFYGTSHILQSVDLSVAEGQTVALLGRNGVGKTTALRAIMGLVPPRAGSIRVLGKEVRGLLPDAIARMGVAYVPDDHRIFPTLTVDENLEIARRLSKRKGPWTRERVLQLFPQLVELGGARGENLSGGERKMLAIGRALMANPALLLLDEPSEGLAPRVLSRIAEVLNLIKQQGQTILMADQHLRFCRTICDRGYILEKGRVELSASMEEICGDERVLSKYLAV